MKKIKFFSIGLCFALVLAGCNNTQKGAAIGAGGGREDYHWYLYPGYPGQRFLGCNP